MSLRTVQEINEGKSLFKSKLYGEYSIRHPLISDEALQEELYQEALEDSFKRGIPSLEEVLKTLDKQGIWTKENEASVARIEMSISNAKKSLERVIPQQRAELLQDIAGLEEQKSQLLEVKKRNMRPCAEDFATKLSFERYVPSLLISPKISEEELEYISDKKMAGLLHVYISLRNRFNARAIKDASIETLVQNLLSITEDASKLFDKSLLELTVYQSSFAFHAKSYHATIQELYGKVDHGIFTDSQSLDDWLAGNERTRDILERDWGKKADSFSSRDRIVAAAKNSGNREKSLKGVQGLL